MKVTETKLPGVLRFEPEVFRDERGAFWETWSKQRYRDAGQVGEFVQDNVSMSSNGVLRGLHFQHPYGQGKLVQVLMGEVYDVAVDVRVGSPTFGQWAGEVLSAENHIQLFVPSGFAHGFLVTSERAQFAYKCTEVYHPEAELGVAWDDPDIGITWPIADPMVSERDGAFPKLSGIDPERLPKYGESPS